MPAYPYSCALGHVTELFRPVAERDSPAACGWCGGEARRDFMRQARTLRLALLPEFSEHHNLSLGQTVSSRKHLAEIQRQRGCEDADVRQDPPTDWE